VVGDLHVLEDVTSAQLGRTRELYAWLPASYETAGGRAYPVVLLHDGRNLFDATMAHSGEWEVDETMTQLAAEGFEAIVVGIPNADDARASEYTPWHHAEWGGGAGAYVAWLVDDVLPLVRASFRTLPGPAATVVGGSSLGALVSLYALFERPDAFGRALAMSSAHSWGGDELYVFVSERATGHGRIWLDVGDSESEDGQPDLAQVYVDAHERLRDLLLARGYDESSLRTRIEPGGVHREHAWARRLPEALRFLLA
jgi:predicted alpha/beta superfamily hydrolase